jgi:hypothetical protein
MKKSELKQLIREEILKEINENLPPITKSAVLGLVKAKKRQEELIKKGYVLGKDFTVVQDPKNKKMYNISPVSKLSENEFDNAMDKFKNKIGPTTGDYSKNVMRNSPESLPGYRELPDTRTDVTDFKKGIKIPSVNAGSTSTLLSKEEVKKWFEEFKTRYKENPQFKIEGTTIKVTNPKYQEALATYAQAVKQFGTKGD